MTIKLVVGLGNPGTEYDKTRHNAGAWFVEDLARLNHGNLRPEKKFFGLYGEIMVGTQTVRLLLPTTFMNHSGQAVSAIANFYKIRPSEILIAHDELDLPAGIVRLKTGGGHGGHNGLRDIIQQLGTGQFHRLRVGIGHPGHRDDVLNYVLGKPSQSDNDTITQAIERAIDHLALITKGDFQAVMNQLHQQ